MIQDSGQISDSKRKRRKRTDDEGRTFTCKCGKSYLSYPALYTHIKTKHADQPLSKLTLSYDNFDSPQLGVERVQRQTHRDKQHIRQRQKEKQKEKQKDKQLQQNFPLYGNSLPEVNNIEVLKQFLLRYFPNAAAKTAPSYKNQLTFPQKREFKQMKDYWANNKKKQDEPFGQFYETPIIFVLGKFITELEFEVENFSYKKYIFMFAFAFKKALSRIKDQTYFREHNASELPFLFDEILREHFLVDNNDYLSNPTVGAKTLYYFGRWLYVNKFTNLSLKQNF